MSQTSEGVQWRERALELRRAQIVDAMAVLAGEHGYTNVSVACLCARAGVSRGCFYELFDSREACLLAVLDEGHRQLSVVISQAFERTDDWLEGGRLALVALLRFFDSEPLLTRTCVVESLAAGPRALKRRERHTAAVTRQILEHWGELAPQEPHPHTNTGVMASLLGVIQNHLVAGRQEPLTSLLGPLVGLLIAPYLDAGTVAAEVERCGALADGLIESQAQIAPEAPLVKVPQMLLNPRAYRARACLRYLAENPGASNGETARAIGVLSHAQISRLLGRMADADLLLKREGRPGQSNAWELTERGRWLVRALQFSPGSNGGQVDENTCDTHKTTVFSL